MNTLIKAISTALQDAGYTLPGIDEGQIADLIKQHFSEAEVSKAEAELSTLTQDEFEDLCFGESEYLVELKQVYTADEVIGTVFDAYI